MKKKKKIWIIGLIVLFLGAIGGITFYFLNDKNKLTVQERAWLDDNISTIQNINIVNNANVFGKNGTGLFYDFLNDFSLEYGMQINPITYNSDALPGGITFGYKNSLADNDTIFYTDHYVLLSKKSELIKDINDIKGKTIGVNQNNSSYIGTYLGNVATLMPYESDTALYTALGTDLEYIVMPLMLNLDQILSNNYNILYHFSDIKSYYVMQDGSDILSSVLKKYYARWSENVKKYFNIHELEVFTDSLKISDSDLTKLQSVSYKFGFLNNSPYEVIMGGKYGGIIAVYLKQFSDFANVEFNFVKYANMNKFNTGIKNKKIDMYFNYYNLNNDYLKTTGPIISYVIAGLKDNTEVINSLNSLVGKTVYVENNSKLQSYLKTINGIKVVPFEKLKELRKIKDDDSFIMLDKNIYEYNASKLLAKYSVRYESKLNDYYEFKVNDNELLSNLFNKFLMTRDLQQMEILGLENHYDTVKSGSIMSNIAKYIIYLLVIALVIILFIIRKSRKITIAKRIKKDDKMRYIDQLTTLKNRNFLNENISIWNNNTIYPQAIIVLDLNRLQEINDIHGYEEGDKQIQAAANALIKTQLDNSEIIRTDGNEFVIYVVGYTQKQVTNYIHKLNKEINKLPYDFGAKCGYSMIMDNIKTVEDAMNEAVEDMKRQKASENEK